MASDQLQLVGECDLEDSDDKESIENSADDEPFEGGHEGGEDAWQGGAHKQANQALETFDKN